MADQPDFKVINACFDAIAPLIRANGSDAKNVERFTYYLLIISAAMADEIGMDINEFRALATSAWEDGKQPCSVGATYKN